MTKRVLFSALALCALWACGGSSIGQPCTVNDDCDNGQTCFTSAPGGYCSKGCSIEGSNADCPGGSVCAQNAELLLCSNTCQSQGDCRADYECNGVTGSDAKACRPKAK